MSIDIYVCVRFQNVSVPKFKKKINFMFLNILFLFICARFHLDIDISSNIFFFFFLETFQHLFQTWINRLTYTSSNIKRNQIRDRETSWLENFEWSFQTGYCRSIHRVKTLLGTRKILQIRTYAYMNSKPWPHLNSLFPINAIVRTS